MKRTNTQKGITLVALIITIVVLLILAVVSIGTVQKSGIIGHAQDAAAAHQEGKESQNNTITDMESMLNKAELEQSIPKYTEQEKEDLANLIIEYSNNKYANYGNPTEEQLATANRAKGDLLAKGLNLEETINVRIRSNDYVYIYYFQDKKVVFNEENDTVREVTADEIAVFEELYKRAKVVDEKLDRGDYTTNRYSYYFDYNGETLEFVNIAGQYEYRYNEEYDLNVWNLPTGRCLGF